jgi:membrane protease YdiL (CAAX protease family)
LTVSDAAGYCVLALSRRFTLLYLPPMVDLPLRDALAAVLAVQVVLASLAVWSYWLHCWSRRRSPIAWQPREPVPWGIQDVVMAGMIYFGLQMLTYQLLPDALAESQRVLAAAAAGNALSVAVIPAVLFALWRCGWGDLGLRRRGVLWDVAYGHIGLLAALVPALLTQMIVRRLLGAEEPVHTIVKLLKEHPTPANWTLAAWSAVVFAPLAEELLFRVVLQGWLEKYLPAAGAIAASSLAFAAMHFGSWPDPLALLPLAVVLGYLYYRRRSLLAPVVLHGAFNGFNLLILYIFPEAG